MCHCRVALITRRYCFSSSVLAAPSGHYIHTVIINFWCNTTLHSADESTCCDHPRQSRKYVSICTAFVSLSSKPGTLPIITSSRGHQSGGDIVYGHAAFDLLFCVDRKKRWVACHPSRWCRRYLELTQKRRSVHAQVSWKRPACNYKASPTLGVRLYMAQLLAQLKTQDNKGSWKLLITP